MVNYRYVVNTFVRYDISCHQQNQESSLFERHLFSNVTKVMLLISYILLCVPINLCKIPGSIHLFKIREKLTPDQENWIWDVLEIDCKEVKVTLN